ncbi:MAG: cytochrome c biogenesis protein CcdA [Chlorobiaceae bacterium]|nr:cytochrome c biogenesis protein CcdA [Chlorobiaceae bacterium]
MTYSFGIIFLAGVVSFLSPCVLSLVPAYVGYLSGQNVGGEKKASSITYAIVNGFFFVLGFSIIFITLGLSASLMGKFLYVYKEIVIKIGGVIIFIFGLQLTGLINIHFLNYDLRLNTTKFKNRKYITSLLMGIFFSAGWSPCIGPVLGSILTAISVSNLSTSQGAEYLAIYSLGLGIPFIAAAAGVGFFNTLLVRYKKVFATIQILTGVVLLIFGVLLFFGIIERLNQYIPLFQLG